jgi:sugar-specific transcriptional regulator TrmB
MRFMDFEEIREKLKQIGLGHNESKIYLVLLKLGPSMAGKIAKESNIDRSAGYDSLKALIKKGLVSYSIEAGRRKFSASSPQRILDFLKEKQEQAQSILPDLSNFYKMDKEQAQVTMYKGVKGLKNVFEDILESARGKENLVIDSSGKFMEKMPFYAPHFIKGLEKNKIKVRHIVRYNAEKKLHSSRTTHVRYLKGKLDSAIMTTNIYANKLALIIWSDIPEAIIIENKAAAEAYRDYFEVLWSHSK